MLREVSQTQANTLCSQFYVGDKIVFPGSKEQNSGYEKLGKVQEIGMET